jgi:hypothetical protein
MSPVKYELDFYIPEDGVLPIASYFSSYMTRSAQRTTLPTILRCHGNVFTESSSRNNSRGTQRRAVASRRDL